MKLINKMTRGEDGRFVKQVVHELTQDFLKENFEYKDGLLYRKETVSSNAKEGCLAGWVNPNNYRYVSISNRKYLLHRLIWLYHYGYLPKQIDHINGDSLDNRVENLRVATQSQNMANKPVRSDSKSRIKGVTKQGNKYYAKICVKGKSFYLGTYETPEKAKECYDFAAEIAFGEYAKQ
jgi:hypothetical protein